MSTIRQKILAANMVRNMVTKEWKTAKEIIVASGYAPSKGHNPHQVFDKLGFQEEMERLGFDEDSAKSVVVGVMRSKRSKPSDKLKATDQVFKVQGSYAPEKRVNLNVNKKLIDDPALRELSEQYEKEMRERLLGT